MRTAFGDNGTRLQIMGLGFQSTGRLVATGCIAAFGGLTPDEIGLAGHL